MELKLKPSGDHTTLLGDAQKFLENFGNNEQTSKEFPVIDEMCKRLVTFFQVRYELSNEYPSLKIASERFNMTEDQVQSYIPQIEDILVRTRFLPPIKYRTTVDDFDPDFVIASSLISDALDKRSVGAKLKQINKTTTWWNKQIKVPHQAMYHTMKVRENYEQIPDLARTSLTRLVEGGDLNALKYAEEKLNIYRPQQTVALDLTKIIAFMMEVVVKYLNPEQMQGFTSDLENVIETQLAKGELQHGE